MSRLIFLIALVTVGWLLYKVYFRQLLAQGTPGKVKLGLMALGLVFLVMAVSGKAPAAFAILGAAMTQVMRFAPLLVRFAPFLKRYLGGAALGGAAASGRAAGGPSESQVRTRWIHMTLDHATGVIDGTVQQGDFAGKRLSSLSIDELRTLHATCVREEPEAARLVEAYVSREHSTDWGSSNQDSGAGNSGRGAAQASTGTMAINEALEVLGLSSGYSKKDVAAAHRSLISKLHPDKGGSNYLATKVNTARSVLLKALKS